MLQAPQANGMVTATKDAEQATQKLLKHAEAVCAAFTTCCLLHHRG